MVAAEAKRKDADRFVYRLALLEIVLGWGQARPALRETHLARNLAGALRRQAGRDAL
jgi:hypothetical protein